MHQSQKSPVIYKIFSWYINYIVKRDFSAYTFNAIDTNRNEAILLFSNHFSWWDGFLMFQLNKVVFKKKFNVLVTSDDYARHWFLKYLGAFAADTKGKDVVETLNYAGHLLNDPDNLVLMFPQGKSYSSYVNSIGFEKGVMQVVNASKKKFQIVFAVTLSDYFGKRRPEMSTYLQKWEAEEYMSLQLLKSEYNKHYNEALKSQNSKE
ncbi:1-acyl-sn-glycerol-3-phosphate acyltransferase [Pedobacter frigoris]|uniref:Glycerol acyltransferase n=1 Tax=Pedobacter frigoris TaxID=2571272 RepID=A0A4U1CE17_9SPHI|nr:1-acyl-sn-glycerol-3-phosphate acyltransferase [Pedobacter frigoris]TKC04454.1 glycerol acyltransferase [Pedobacter frigoris]